MVLAAEVRPSKNSSANSGPWLPRPWRAMIVWVWSEVDSMTWRGGNSDGADIFTGEVEFCVG